MNLASWIAIIALAIVVFFAVRYIVKEKKKGNKCIGCPYADCCMKEKELRELEEEICRSIKQQS